MRRDFSLNLERLDQFRPGEEFLGLFTVDGKNVVWIIQRAKEETAGFRFVTYHGSPHPHYVPDPIGWARLPYHSAQWVERLREKEKRRG